MSKIKVLLMVLVISVLIIACAEESQYSPTEQLLSDATPDPNNPGVYTPTPPITFEPTKVYTPTVTPTVILDPDPVEVEFTTEDGQILTGLYYPADTNPAPLIILMHWARGDQEEWREIAYWLQNRNQLIREPDYNKSWKSSNWYPENTSGKSLGVFTFNLRSCTGGCQDYLPGSWLLDVQAAMDTAIGLTGVNRFQILTAGTSIGADGAIDGCIWLNQQMTGKCLGTFVLSPGSFLTIPFDMAAGRLLQYDPPRPVYCLYGLRDDAAVETCSSVPEARLVDYGYIENHGFELLQPNQDPDPMNLLQEFIHEALLDFSLKDTSLEQ